MLRGFSERKREQIQATLLRQGSTFLTTYGIRKTNVEDLTRAARRRQFLAANRGKSPGEGFHPTRRKLAR
jgi:hypothetical protein